MEMTPNDISPFMSLNNIDAKSYKIPQDVEWQKTWTKQTTNAIRCAMHNINYILIVI